MAKTNILRKAVMFTASLAYLGKGAVDEAFGALEKQNFVDIKSGKEAAENIKLRVRQTQASAKKKVFSQLRGFVKELGVLTVDDIEDIRTKRARTKKT